MVVVDSSHSRQGHRYVVVVATDSHTSRKQTSDDFSSPHNFLLFWQKLQPSGLFHYLSRSCFPCRNEYVWVWAIRDTTVMTCTRSIHRIYVFILMSLWFMVKVECWWLLKSCWGDAHPLWSAPHGQDTYPTLWQPHSTPHTMPSPAATMQCRPFKNLIFHALALWPAQSSQDSIQTDLLRIVKTIRDSFSSLHKVPAMVLKKPVQKTWT